MLCAERVGQVTKTYRDIEAVTHLLEEVRDNNGMLYTHSSWFGASAASQEKDNCSENTDQSVLSPSDPSPSTQTALLIKGEELIPCQQKPKMNKLAKSLARQYCKTHFYLEMM